MSEEDISAQTQLETAHSIKSTEENTFKSCRSCGLCIPKAAKKCHECGSYQDWRRFVNLGQAVLALLIAFMTVGATAIPAIFVEGIRSLEADLRVDCEIIYLTTVHKQGDAKSRRRDIAILVLFVRNHGRSPGAVFQGTVKVGGKSYPMYIRDSQLSDGSVIGPNEGKIVKFSIDQLSAKDIDTLMKEGDGTVELGFASSKNFRGTAKCSLPLPAHDRRNEVTDEKKDPVTDP